MSLNVYSDDTLLEYIMVLLANNHAKEKVYEELVLFMEPALTEQFVIWLFSEVEQLLQIPVQQPVQQNNFVPGPVPVEVPQVAQVQTLQSIPLQQIQPVFNEPLLANDVQMGAASNNSASARNRSFTKAVESATSQPPKQQQQVKTTPRTFSQAESKPEPSSRRSSIRLASQQPQRQPQRSRSPRRSNSDRIVSRGDAPRSVNVDEGGRVQKIRLAVDFERDERSRGRKRIDDAPKLNGSAQAAAAAAPTIKTKCKYWPNCKAGPACPNVHPSEPCKHFPNCSKGDACTYLHPVIPCRFQERCTNPLCNYQHRAPMAMLATAAGVNATSPMQTNMQTPLQTPMTMAVPAQVPVTTALSSIPCRFHPRCINPSCPYLHPVKLACRYGVDCTRPDCHFEHPEGRKSAAKSAIYQPCRYGKQCARVDCPYLHESTDNGNEAQMDVSSTLPTDAQMSNN